MPYKNPEDKKVADKRYHVEHLEKELERSKNYRLEHPGYGTEYSKRWRAANPEKSRAATKRYRDSFTDEQRQAKKEYAAAWWSNKGNQAMREKKRAFKAELVREFGGACILCGYNKHLAALDFDHIDPSIKAASIAVLTTQCRFDEARKEAQKCRLLCSNCHREQTYGDWE
jgi:hypothetical protein